MKKRTYKNTNFIIFYKNLENKKKIKKMCYINIYECVYI